MSLQQINLGNQVNDGLGDDLRTAFQKVNANFATLGDSLTTTASNVGTTGFGIFKRKNGPDLEFKNIVSGTKILIEDDAGGNALIINSTQPDAFVRVDTDSGIVNASNGTRLTIQGGDNIDVTAAGSVITVDSKLDLAQILTVLDFGNCSGTFENPLQMALTFANVDFGTIENPGSISVDLGVL